MKLDDTNIEYSISFAARKSISMGFTAQGQLAVKAPKSMTNQDVLAFMERKMDWIVNHYNQVMEQKNDRYVLTEDERNRFIDIANRVIPERVRLFAAKMDARYNQIHIREQKTRWGSCSSRKNLNFNWKLVLMPPEILDYVIIHELCHLSEMNHSDRFWNLVQVYCPDYRQRKKWLRDNGMKYIC
jgi:predicted metal-dependent hydrolase